MLPELRLSSSVEVTVLERRQPAAVRAQIATALCGDLVQSPFRRSEFAARHLAVADALCDAVLLICKAVVDFSGLRGRGERRHAERDGSGSGEQGLDEECVHGVCPL